MTTDVKDRRIAALALVNFDAQIRLMAADDRLAQAVFKVQAAEVEAVCGGYQGRLAQRLGSNSLLFAFPSAVNAIRAAMDIQLGMARLRLRIGLDLADVDPGTGPRAGLVLQIEALAAPGGIALSDPLYQLVRTQLDARIQPRGTLPRSAEADEMLVWQVDLGPGTTLAATPASETPGPAPSSFFAEALRRSAAAAQARQAAPARGGLYKIETFTSGQWTIVDAFASRHEALSAAQQRAEVDGSAARVLEMVWDEATGVSQSRRIAEVRGGTVRRPTQAPAPCRDLTYEIEANLGGAWKLVGSFTARDDALAAARVDAAADRCKVRLMEVAWDSATGMATNRLLLELNGAPASAPPRRARTGQPVGRSL